jgi:hypothetical protein
MSMPAPLAVPDPVVFLPGARGEDPVAQYWLRQVTLRLRREVCWLWHERGLQADGAIGPGALPPFADRALAALDLVRYDRDKREFFANDITAHHLSQLIGTPPPPELAVGPRGSFGWVARTLPLAPVECFVLAVALLPSIDSAAGNVIATCLNDPSRNEPTLALAQRLWDKPDELLCCFDPAHPLLRHGLVTLPAGHGAGAWQAPLSVAPLVARELLFPGGGLPPALKPVIPVVLPHSIATTAVARVRSAVNGERGKATRMGILPVIAAAGAPLAEIAAACAERNGLDTVQPAATLAREQLAQALCTAWLRGHAVFLPMELLADPTAHDTGIEGMPLPGLPLLVFVGLHERAAVKKLGTRVLPPITVPPLSYAERIECWRHALPWAAHTAFLGEVARRFRYEHAAIARIGAELAALDRPPTTEELLAAARADLDLGALAQPVSPRFGLDELMLPPVQTRQLDEVIVAMNNLTRVHYDWGAARAWNEGGLAALFSGPPGTGKTMAAEAIALSLALPLYRIDLSQVVNKYIGETEKNLRRLFDAADSADLILFFDEADALFGKRTEVKDAHDRYANLEISYLLERMERFKGLAILATNRKKDLDEAFLRRLRFVVEFPLPGAAERLRIWRRVIPDGVDASALDFEFLAQRFALAGGHIRAIVFQACLQSAGEGAPRVLTMPAIIRAVQREYGKLERPHSLDQFGPYAPRVAAERTAR